jgi:hypothetical protein
MIEDELFVLPSWSSDMDITPSSILLIPVGARLIIAVLRYSFDILFVEPSNAFLFCMAIGILSYKTIMYSSLLSGVMVGLGSRAMLTYIVQGRRWTVVCGFLLGIFASDVVTLFWTYVNQESLEFEKQRVKKLKRKTTPKRRISDPRPPNPSWRSSIADTGDIVLQAQGLDKDTVVLMRKTASAEAEVKRLQEERKWAMYVDRSSGHHLLTKIMFHFLQIARQYCSRDAIKMANRTKRGVSKELPKGARGETSKSKKYFSTSIHSVYFANVSPRTSKCRTAHQSSVERYQHHQR